MPHLVFVFTMVLFMYIFNNNRSESDLLKEFFSIEDLADEMGGWVFVCGQEGVSYPRFDASML